MATFHLIAYQNRTTKIPHNLVDLQGDPIALADTDRVRLKIGRGFDATPDLDIIHGTTTAGGSGIEIVNRTHPDGASIVIWIGQSETLDPGVYTAEISVVDDSVTSPLANPILHSKFGAITFIGGMAGNVEL